QLARIQHKAGLSKEAEALAQQAADAGDTRGLVTSPTVSYMDAESVVSVPDTTSTADPQELKLGNDPAPADFDSGDHVNLTADGYLSISNAYDLVSLGPDA
ncbi:hypothetical protein, partial [Streptomyces aureus]|uniref:hypothetical protein n=1 Tax=Streptomyces aureus TaxID=193461 RepID=UPI0033E082FA